MPTLASLTWPTEGGDIALNVVLLLAMSVFFVVYILHGKD